MQLILISSRVIIPLELLRNFPCTPCRTIIQMLTISLYPPVVLVIITESLPLASFFFFFLPLHLRHLQLTSALDQLLFKWTMLHTSKKGMKNTGTSVLMARTVPVFFAALRIVERERGGTEGYTSALPKWTPMPASSSQLPSVCLTWCIGYHIFTFKIRGKSVIWALLTEVLREMVS